MTYIPKNQPFELYNSLRHRENNKLAVVAVSALHVFRIFLLCFGIAALSAIFPLVRMLRLQPVDVISEK